MERPDDRTRAVPSGGPGSRSRDRSIRTGTRDRPLGEREEEMTGGRKRAKERERERKKMWLTLFLDPAAPTEADAEREVSSRPARRSPTPRDVIRDGRTAGECTAARWPACPFVEKEREREGSSFTAGARPLPRAQATIRFSPSSLLHVRAISGDRLDDATPRNQRTRDRDASAKTERYETGRA